MKVFIAVLILIFSFQTWTKADDIRDFVIEGISIGDSALDYIDRNYIKKRLNSKYVYYYKDNKYAVISTDIKTTNYDFISLTFNPNDQKFIIHAIEGVIKFSDDITECLKKKDQVTKDLKSMFSDVNINDAGTYNHQADLTGNSTQTVVDFNFNNGGLVRSVCHDWSDKLTKEKLWTDEFKVYILSKEFLDFVNNEAY